MVAVRVGLEPGRPADEVEDPIRVERLQPRHAELLVGVALVQQPDVAQHVVERVAELGSGHRAREQALEQLLARDRARGPAVVERGQARGVRSDNVHRPHRTRSAAMTRDEA